MTPTAASCLSRRGNARHGASLAGNAASGRRAGPFGRAQARGSFRSGTRSVGRLGGRWVPGRMFGPGEGGAINRAKSGEGSVGECGEEKRGGRREERRREDGIERTVLLAANCCGRRTVARVARRCPAQRPSTTAGCFCCCPLLSARLEYVRNIN